MQMPLIIVSKTSTFRQYSCGNAEAERVTSGLPPATLFVRGLSRAKLPLFRDTVAEPEPNLMGTGFAWLGKTGPLGMVDWDVWPVLGGRLDPAIGGPGVAVVPKVLEATPLRMGAINDDAMVMGGAVLGLGFAAILRGFAGLAYES